MPCYEAERRYRRPMAASPIPASAISGPTTAQTRDAQDAEIAAEIIQAGATGGVLQPEAWVKRL